MGALKNVYFALENKYYAVLDKLNKVLPVYKIVDPIDRVVPSFILLTAVVLILAVFLAVSIFPLTGYVATIKVMGENNSPLQADLAVYLNSDMENLQSFSTSVGGFVSIPIPSEEISAIVVITQSNYERFNEEITLFAGQVTEITLTKSGTATFEGAYQIVVTDETQPWNSGITVTLNFICTASSSSPATKQNNSGIFNVDSSEVPSGCGTLRATATASGYNPRTKILTRLSPETNYISLSPVSDEETKGGLYVIVYDSDNDTVAYAPITIIKSGSYAGSADATSSGDHTFDNLSPGTYKAIVSMSDGRIGESEEVQVNAGEVSDTEVRLNEPGEGDKLLFKVVDESGGNISANISVFKDGEIIYVSPANFTGVKTLGIPGGDHEYTAVVSKEDYVTAVETLNTYSQEQTQPQIIELEEINTQQPNFGELEVTVYNDDDEEVEDAKVYLYYSMDNQAPEHDVIINPLGSRTIADGTYFFTNLPAGEYYVKAEWEGMEGISEQVAVWEGAEFPTEVNVIMELSKGRIEVHITEIELFPDYKVMESLEGASVRFYRSEGNEIYEVDSCETDDEGECTSRYIMANEQIYIEATKTGYIPSTSPEKITIIKENISSVNMVMVKENNLPPSADGVITFFEKVCTDSACTETASKIESATSGENTYYLRFNTILLKTGMYDSVKEHLRVGLDADDTIPATGYGIALNQVNAVNNWDIGLSNCFDADDQFTVPTPTAPCENVSNGGAESSMAKSALVEWKDIEGPLLIPVTAKVYIEEGLSTGEELDVSYAAKATINPDDYFDPAEDNAHVETFLVNEMACTTTSDPVLWSFDIGGEALQEGSANKTRLAKDQQYNIDYEFLNCSEDDFTDSTLVAEEVGSGADAFDFLDGTTLFSAEEISAEESVSSADFGPLTVLAEEEKDTAKIKFSFDSGTNIENSNPEIIFSFEIIETDVFYVTGLPESVLPFDPLPIIGVVRENTAEGEFAEGATVGLYYPNESAPFTFVLTDTDGEFTADLPADISNRSHIAIKITKPGFFEYSQNIDVSMARPLDPRFSCLGFTRESLSLSRFPPIIDPQNSFTIISGCDQDVYLQLSSLLITTPSSDSSFALTPGASQEVLVSTNILPNTLPTSTTGLFYVFVNASFEENESLNFIKEIEVTVTDSRKCFVLDNYKFELNIGESEQRILTNKCYYPSDNPITATPDLLGALSILLNNPGDVSGDDRVTFDVTINVLINNSINETLATLSGQSILRGEKALLWPGFDPATDILAQYSEHAPITALNFTFTSSNSEVQVWLQGDSIMAYYPPDPTETATTKEYPFTLTNDALLSTTYTHMDVEGTVNPTNLWGAFPIAGGDVTATIGGTSTIPMDDTTPVTVPVGGGST